VTPRASSTTDRPTGRGWLRRAGEKPAYVLLPAVLAALLLLATQLHPYLGDYTDDAEFLILGQGLARGQGYAWVNSPERPAHNRYPPGYAALVAIVQLASGTSGDALAAVLPSKLVTAAAFAGSIALLWPLARRRLTERWAAFAVALYALNPFAIRFAVQVMSDLPYIMVELGALWWADHLHKRCGRPGWSHVWPLALFGALLAAGTYLRSVGLAAAVGGLVWAWRRFGPRSLVVASGVYLLLMAPWWVRDASLAGGWRYLEELTSSYYLDPSAGTVGPLGLLARAAGNGLFVLGKPGAFGWPGFAVAAGLGMIVLAGYARTVIRVGGAAEWVAAPLVLAVLVWPIRTGRYLLPVVPLAGIYAIAGALLAARWLRDRSAGRWRLEPVVAAGIVVALVVEAVYSARASWGNAQALAAGGGPAGYYGARPEWARFITAAGWTREHLEAGDVLMSRRQFQLYVYSGHYTEKYRFDTTAEELAYLTAGTARRYVVEDAFGVLRGEFDALPVALRRRGGDLLLRYETADPPVRVWELVRPSGP
jgi:hypothetical protein